MPDRTGNISFPITLRHEHRLIFTRDVFARDNDVLSVLLMPQGQGENVRVLVFWDGGLAVAFPGMEEKLAQWFAARSERMRLATPPILLSGGEGVKNDFRQLENA